MKKLLTGAVAAMAVLSSTQSVAFEQSVDVLAGASSNYVFRGIQLDGDGTPFAALDYTAEGFLVGTYLTTSPLEDGEAEYDFYVGYGGTVGAFELGATATQYNYTNYDGDETEIVLSASVAGFSAELINGKAQFEGTDNDYIGGSLSYDLNAGGVDYGVQVGTLDYDLTVADGGLADYSWVELSFAMPVWVLDTRLAVGTQFDIEDDIEEDEYINFTVSKSFNLL